jgi:hypothetical protein
MNALLAIAADFFEHLTDPSFGREANDSYSLKFHVLMDNDAEAAQQLATASLGRDDVDSMSAAAWLWYLNWRETVTDEQPSREFLDVLYDETADPDLRSRIVEVRTRGRQETQAEVGPGSEGTQSSWIEDRIREITGEQDSGSQDVPLQQTRIEDAWALLSSLIDIDSSESLDAARRLLDWSWPGRGALRELAAGRIAQRRLTEREDRELRQRLGLLG